MEWKNIQTELRRLLALVDGWAAEDRIPPLERDLALDKLRAVYERLRFPDGAGLPGTEMRQRREVSASEPLVRIDLEEMLAAPERVGVTTLVSEREPRTEAAGMDKSSASVLPDAPPVVSEDRGGEDRTDNEPLVDAQHERLATTGTEPIAEALSTPMMTDCPPVPEGSAPLPAATIPPESEPEEGDETAPARQAVDAEHGQSDPRSELRQEPVLNSLFDLDDLVDRRRKNRRVILSLYGSEEEEPAVTEQHGTGRGSQRRDKRERTAAPATVAEATATATEPIEPIPPVADPLVGHVTGSDAMGVGQPPQERGGTDTGLPEQVQVPDHVLEDRPAMKALPEQPAANPGAAQPEDAGASLDAKRSDAGESPPAESVPEAATPSVEPPAHPNTITASSAADDRLPSAGAPVSGRFAAEADAVERPVSIPGSQRPDGEREKGSRKVLGEVIGQGVQTLADRITAPHERTATLAQGEPVEELRRAIGVNDRFLMIRDLFAGDAAAYERTIDRLEGFDDLDDCLIHIAEQYAWDPNSDGARLLADLLERKLG